MFIRDSFVRITANTICLLRGRALRSANTRFLVFTGTSGKTLARTAATYALRKAGLSVISPPYGYTNELGIVLAALGIESLSLFSREGLGRIATSRPPQNLYVCVELGADWRADIPWFLKHFIPYGVCVTNVSSEEWTRPLDEIWKDKKELIDHIPSRGFLCWSDRNESVQKIGELADSRAGLRKISFHAEVRRESGVFSYEANDVSCMFKSELADVFPYTEVFGFAVSCLKAVRSAFSLSKNLFLAYHPPAKRFSRAFLKSGVLLISDTYKAVPQCTAYVLNFALELPAKKRIALVSAIRPLWRDKRRHYERLAKRLSSFDKAYFVGPGWACDFIKSCDSRIITIEKNRFVHEDMAAALNAEIERGTVIVIKGAEPYRLDMLVGMLGRVQASES